AWRAFQDLAIRSFGTDTAVKDPSRLMRLPGTVTSPDDKKRDRGYTPELTAFTSTGEVYDPDDLRCRLEALNPAASVVTVSRAATRATNVVPASPASADLTELRDALFAIPNDARFDDWEAWNKIGMALWRATGGSEGGFQLLNEWSRSHQRYDQDE